MREGLLCEKMEEQASPLSGNPGAGGSSRPWRKINGAGCVHPRERELLQRLQDLATRSEAKKVREVGKKGLEEEKN